MAMLCNRILPFLAPGLLLVGCGDNIEPAADEGTELGLSEYNVPEHNPGDAPREIDFFVGFSSPNCDAPVGQLEVVATYRDDGTFIPNPECTFLFADGSTAQGCLVEHEFPAGGVHDVTVTVRDPATGASVTKVETGFVYEPFVADLEVSAPACGLELSFRRILPGGATEAFVNIYPVELVTSSPEYRFAAEATVTVSEPGVYTVELDAEDERTTGPICSRLIRKEVTVTECPHEHEPGCGH